MTSHLLLASLLLISATACSAGSDSANAEALTGQWTDCEFADSTFTFGEDNSFAYDEICDGEGCEEDHLAGTFEAGPQRVTATSTSADGDNIVQVFTYYANDEHLIFPAAFPEGSHDGLVGTWNSEYSVTENGVALGGGERVMVLNADNTGTVTEYTGAAKTFEASGTWGPDEDIENVGGFELKVMPEGEGFTISISFQLIDDAVLGSPRFCRVTTG